MALLLIVLRSRLRLAFVNVGHLLSGKALPQSAGSMPYGVAIALGTIVILVTHYG
jgi:prepilin peptidase CpaA